MLLMSDLVTALLDDTSSEDFPLVSIVTPVLNMVSTIRRTVESVLLQDYPSLEYIVMDGGSTDGTLDIVRQYEGRLTLYSGPDNGQSDAINKGFAVASGQYLNWLCADDFLLPGAIRHLVALLQESPDAALGYGHTVHLYPAGVRVADPNVWEGTIGELLNGDNFVPQAACLFTRQAWEMFGPLSVALHYAMDWDLWIKMSRKFAFRYTSATLAEVTVQNETKSSSGGLPRYDEIRYMLEGHEGRAAHTYYKIGREYYERNQMPEARRYFRIALLRKPSLLVRRRLRGMMLKSYLGGRIMDVARDIRARLGF
jgi:glycosyltransferase involved in cell wall biosynthesis